MRALKSLLAALVLGGSAAASAASTEAEVYINDLLSREPVLQQNWSRLISTEVGLPQWVFTLTGVFSPVETLEVGDKVYRVGSVCQQHDCSNNKLYVAFSSDTQQVDALYVVVPENLPEGEAPSSQAKQRWLGGPSAEVRKLLEDQLQSDPNWR